MVQEFLEGQRDFDGIDDADRSNHPGSQKDGDDDIMSLASSGGTGKDIELDEQGIWKEMQRILKLEEDGNQEASDTGVDDYLAGRHEGFDDDGSIPSSSEGVLHLMATLTYLHQPS